MNRSDIATLSDEALRKEWSRVSDWWLCVRSLGEFHAADAEATVLAEEFERRNLKISSR